MRWEIEQLPTVLIAGQLPAAARHELAVSACEEANPWSPLSFVLIPYNQAVPEAG